MNTRQLAEVRYISSFSVLFHNTQRRHLDTFLSGLQIVQSKNGAQFENNPARRPYVFSSCDRSGEGTMFSDMMDA